MLSDYCKRIQARFNISSAMVQKLVPNLMDKTKYTLHYRNLQLYLDLGLKIKNVHRVLRGSHSHSG